jgi:hypothetical protein
MKFSMRGIPVGGTLHVEGEAETDFLGLGEAGAEAAGPLAYRLDIMHEDGLIHASGSLCVPVRFRCVVTLEPFTEEIHIDPFEVHKECAEGEWVDLTAEAREDIQLSLPAHPRSKNARDGATSRFAINSDPARDSGPGPWSALDQIKPTT